jgi:hypothetical protein
VKKIGILIFFSQTTNKNERMKYNIFFLKIGLDKLLKISFPIEFKKIYNKPYQNYKINFFKKKSKTIEPYIIPFKYCKTGS